jgi:hypothetical protein
VTYCFFLRAQSSTLSLSLNQERRRFPLRPCLVPPDDDSPAQSASAERAGAYGSSSTAVLQRPHTPRHIPRHHPHSTNRTRMKRWHGWWRVVRCGTSSGQNMKDGWPQPRGPHHHQTPLSHEGQKLVRWKRRFRAWAHAWPFSAAAVCLCVRTSSTSNLLPVLLCGASVTAWWSALLGRKQIWRNITAGASFFKWTNTAYTPILTGLYSRIHRCLASAGTGWGCGTQFNSTHKS